MNRFFLLALMPFLAGCGIVGKPPAVDASAELRRHPVRQRIVDIALAEWDYFGRQEVVLAADGESIPRVGVWEDEDESHSRRVGDYWRAVGKPDRNGRDCDQAWSAAFTSWVMRSAGVSEQQFPPAEAHGDYLKRIIGESPGGFRPRAVDTYGPRPGDLICASREPAVLTPLLAWPTPLPFLRARLHCDIVVNKAGDRLEVIGGNVRNSVSKTILPLDQRGRLRPLKKRQWILVLENRL